MADKTKMPEKIYAQWFKGQKLDAVGNKKMAFEMSAMNARRGTPTKVIECDTGTGRWTYSKPWIGDDEELNRD